MQLNLVRIIGTLRLPSNPTDPYALFGLRGEFMDSLRRVACSTPGAACPHCRESSSCPYAVTFGQQLSSDPFARRRHQKPPLPFVFDFPVLPRESAGEATTEFALTVFGSATAFLGGYLRALETLFGENGRYGTLLRLESADGRENRIPLVSSAGSDPEGVMVLAADDLSDILCPTAELLQLVLTTPLVLLDAGRPLREFDPSRFLRTLVRRVSAIAYYCGGEELPCDYRELSRASREVRLADSSIRWSAWRGSKLAGLTGEARLEGDLAPFLPFLAIGRYTHLGKGAAFGMGRFTLR